MCEALCRLDGGGFPTSEQLLRYSAKKLAAQTPLGYRTRTVLAVARLDTEGKLPLDEWAVAGNYDQIRQSLQPIWGIGPYSLNHMLVLLGWYGDIPVDSEVLRYLRAVHFGGREVSRTKAIEPYDRYGQHKYLAFKFRRMARRLNYINK
jgi:3-methyladenine DNA glycosylase/8-oxoguanine DNA glycosylase